VLAGAATVIASQAVISGAFSLTSQAIRLGFLPRVAIRHTSSTEAGQIYIPLVNHSSESLWHARECFNASGHGSMASSRGPGLQDDATIPLVLRCSRRTRRAS
jgi:hypothetical protein